MLVVIVFAGIPATATLANIGVAAVLGAVNTLGTLLLYRALSIGKISIASPVTSAFGGVALLLSLLAGDKIPFGGVLRLLLSVTVLMALIFLHERLARRQWVGVGIIFAATVLIGYFQNFSS